LFGLFFYKSKFLLYVKINLKNIIYYLTGMHFYVLNKMRKLSDCKEIIFKQKKLEVIHMIKYII